MAKVELGGTPPRRATLVVDDHPLVRHGFALSVRELYPGTEVFEAGSLSEALEILRHHPDLGLVLFDLNLDGRGGQQGLRTMVEALGGAPLVVVSASDSATDIIESVRAGAKGYILKTASAPVLEHALSLVLSGETYVPLPRTALAGAATAEPSRVDLVDRLTDRQRDVFNLLLAGHSNKEIARTLGVLEGTVKVHVRAIMQKLGVKNRTQVAVAAARAGCFPEEV